MSKLTRFVNQAINIETATNLKGGVFCDIYLGHVSEEGEAINPTEMQKAIELDRIASEKGFISALFSGGGSFIYQYKYA